MNELGAKLLPNKKCSFKVWAPEKKSMILHIISPKEQKINMIKDESGYFSVLADDINEECKYFFMPDGKKDYPDPASNFQPNGVHGPSQVINHDTFHWTDISWRGEAFENLILYEMHVGTFTPEGTFEAIIPLLDEIKSIGVNALELMPVSQFPGSRNWGYDGVYPYAVQNSYGGPNGLKKLVNACHNNGIAVFLDVVYNHLGPEGNYFNQFGPYFTNKYQVPWGAAINFDDSWCDGVRDYFSDNPCHWFKNYHIDGLRVDAIHMIYDTGAVNFWELTQQKIKLGEQKLGRKFYMIAESDFNSPKVVKSPELSGFGFDAQWLDDFHHALYVLIDKKGKERYEDFGSTEQLAKAYTDGFVHSGEVVKFRKRKHGASSAGIPGEKFIAFNQNHDQIGNRVKGERLSVLVDSEHQKVAAAALMLSPYIPMLFMGEEYGEDNPFFYFVSHTDENLIKAVREGRKKEFADYKWKIEPPDPQSESTFEESKINWQQRNQGKHKVLLEWTRTLISLRKTSLALQNTDKNYLRVYLRQDSAFILHRKSKDEQHQILCFFNLSNENIEFVVPSVAKTWTKILDSKDGIWTENHEKGNDKFSSPQKIKAAQNITTYGCSIVVYSNDI
jgi:maltooligosyltrehalose trehalohydrolase